MYHLFPLPFFIVSLVFTALMRKKWVDSIVTEKHSVSRKNHLVYGAFKILTQLIVILIGFLCFFLASSKNQAFSIIVLCGLCASIFGDVALFNIKSDRVFLVGLLVFLIAISLYAGALTIATGFRLFDLVPASFLAAVFILLLAYFLPGLRKEWRIPLIVYGFVWCYLIARAFTLFYSPGFSIIQAMLFSGGAISFFYGDIRIAVWKFKNPRLSLTSEPVTYAVGQVCIALSLAYFPV